MQLYNTMAKSKQPFTTRAESPNSVQMYVCGVTVYDYSHIGKVISSGRSSAASSTLATLLVL
jgi:cysteinyl-tRNA synthetase